MAGVNVLGPQQQQLYTSKMRTSSDSMAPPDDNDVEMESMEPDIKTTTHMSYVDGRCACCPYGFHIDLDFLRYLDSLNKSGGVSADSLSNLRMIHQNKKKLRKSMEVFLRRQEMAAVNSPDSLRYHDRDDEESKRLLSMVEREESVTSKILDEFDSSVSEHFMSAAGRKPLDDSQRYYSEAKLTLSRPPGNGGQYLTTDYDSSSSVSISSGPPSPGLHYHHSTQEVGGTHHHLELSRLNSGGSQTSSLKRTSNGDNLLRKMTTTTTTTKSMTSAPEPANTETETVITLDGSGVPPGMTLISSSTLHTIREQMAACLQRLKELEEENKALKALQVRASVLKEEKKMLSLQLKSMQDQLAARRPPAMQTVGVGDCTINDSFSPDNDKQLHRSPNGDFGGDIQVIRKINLESMVSPRGAPPPVAKKPCRSIGVGDGNVFSNEIVATLTKDVPPAVVRVHEKELSTEQKTEVHEKEIKTVFLGNASEVTPFKDRPQVLPKPLTRSIGVGSGNVFESNNSSESEKFQLHEKELRTVYIEGDGGASQKERKITRNVGISCKAAMRDVGVQYHHEDEAPMTRNIAVGVGEIGVNEQGWFGSSCEPGERSDTSIHVTNTALQQLNMAAFQSRHLRISNEQLQQVLDMMLKKNLRSVGVQCRFATVDKSVSAVGNGNCTGINQVTVGCSEDRVDVDVVPIRQWRSIGVDNRPSVFHRACGADVVYRVDSSTNTQTQGVRLERATNTDTVTKYPAATNTDSAPLGESASTETETKIFHKISALSDAMTDTEELGSSISPCDEVEKIVNSSSTVVVRTGGSGGAKARSTDNRTSRDLLTLGVLSPSETNVTAASSSVADHSFSLSVASMPAMPTSKDMIRSAVDFGDTSFSSSLPDVNIPGRSVSAPVVATSGESTTEELDSSIFSSQSDVLSASTSSRLTAEHDPMDSSEGSVDTLCSVVWRGDGSSEPLVKRRVWSTHTTIRSAPANFSVEADGTEGSTAVKDQNIGPATSIKICETTTKIQRTAPGDDIGHVTDCVGDNLGTGDGSLRSIMKSSSTSPVARRRKEITFVDNLLVGSSGTSTHQMAEGDIGAVSGSDDSQRSSASFDEGTYDGRHGYVVYTCKDDSSAQTQMLDQHFRETYEMSSEMLASCKKYALWLEDSTGISAKELNASLSVVQQEWFAISGNKLTNPSQVEDYLNAITRISRNLLEHIVNMADANGNTALHYAVSHGNFEVVGLILDTEVVDVNQPNRAGYTAIMLASLADVQTDRQRDIVQRLFQSGNVNIRAAQAGQTALMLAVSHGKHDLAQMLINAGADVNVQDDDGSTALMCASEHGHIDIVKLLLAQPDCDVTLTDNDDSTAMSIALEAGHRDIGVLLYAHVNFRPGSPKIKKKMGSRISVSPSKK